MNRAFAGSTEKFATVICQLSQSSGADVLYKSDSNKLELFGTERQVRNAYQLLSDMTFFKVCLYYRIYILHVDILIIFKTGKPSIHYVCIGIGYGSA